MARKPVTVSLPEDLVRETGRFCRAHSVTLSEIAREAFRDYLYRREIGDARQRFSALAQKRGVLTEQALLKKLV